MGKLSSKDVKIDVTPADGNVFEDLGFSAEEAARLALKTDLAVFILKWIESKQLTQLEAAGVLRVTRPEVSLLKNIRLEKVSTDKLIDMVYRVGGSVELRIRKSSSRAA